MSGFGLDSLIPASGHGVSISKGWTRTSRVAS